MLQVRPVESAFDLLAFRRYMRKCRLEQTGNTLSALMRDIKSDGTAAFLIYRDEDTVPTGGFMASIYPGPTGKIFDVEFAGTDDGVGDWAGEWLEVLEDMARDLGCAHLAFFGRPGYDRRHRKVLKEGGFKPIKILYWKKL